MNFVRVANEPWFGLDKRLKMAAKKAQKIVAARALEDCNRYCRKQSGKLIASSYFSSDIANGELIWNTPYARKVYYLGEPLTNINPLASKMWAHKAGNIHFAKWRELAAQVMRKEMK